jgi:cytidylate kinase
LPPSAGSPIIESNTRRRAAVQGNQAAKERRRLPKTIAIDGPVASGKSDVGVLVARRLGCLFLDTGAMYRALTWLALRRGLDPEDEEAITRLVAETNMEVSQSPPGSGGPPGGERCRIRVDGEDATPHLRTPEVEAAVSLVSRVPAVRREMVRIQRQLAQQGPTVMVGRDIGTTVLPDADLKVYLEASREERARRRCRQLGLEGQTPSFDAVLADLERRDNIDSSRELSPLRPAADAVIIKTDGVILEDVVKKVLSLAEART